ncbi:hypothetical protein BHM03_00027334 [Ensete ventricosum]|uniref:Uncharacterized protein n=1 Tax=Ensete ventricosum TaxID=4639 RepID=A0A445MHH8_ENSVE|nr:hypothetical protein BHM03_00027334 [Ensete ventricosum]
MEIEGGRVTGSGRRIGKGRSERRERRRRHMAGGGGGGGYERRFKPAAGGAFDPLDARRRRRGELFGGRIAERRRWRGLSGFRAWYGGGILAGWIAALFFVRGGGSGGPCRRHRRQRLRIPRQGDRQKGHPRRRSHGRQAPTRPTRKVSL